MNYDYSFNGVDLVQTCGACPEAYNAFKDGMYVGHLRLRHGTFRVDDQHGNVRFTAITRGDGVFCIEERDHYLRVGCTTLSC